MATLERRLYSTRLTLERRGAGRPIIRGHAAVFNRLSEDLGGFKERIRPGAFSKSLASNPDVRAMFNHDPNLILARTKSGTLRVSQDSEGLAYEIDPPETSYARDLMESLDRGDVDQSSFGFYVVTDEWHKEGGQMVRELVEVDIHNGDVSPVTYPAYPQTDAQAARAFCWPNGVPEQVRKAMNYGWSDSSYRGTRNSPDDMASRRDWLRRQTLKMQEDEIRASEEHAYRMAIGYRTAAEREDERRHAILSMNENEIRRGYARTRQDRDAISRAIRLLAQMKQDDLARALEKLQVQDRDYRGNILPCEEIMLALSERFSSMQIGERQIAARRLFGNLGPDIAVILARGKAEVAGIEEDIASHQRQSAIWG